jgi:hypothetical protein
MGHGRFVLKFAAFAIAFLLIGTSAWADIVTVSVTGQVWRVFGNWGNAPTADPVASGTSTADVPVIKQTEMSFTASQVNFSASGAQTLADFLFSGGAVYSDTTGASDLMSNCSDSAFNSSTDCYSTVIRLTGTYDFLAGTTYTINHDDGVVLFAGGTTTNRLPAGSELPTVDVASSWTPSVDTGLLGFTIYYMGTNGNPEDLQLSQSTVPDGGATLMLLGGALLGLGTLRRKFRV